ncbi:MAG TPA: DUF2141 domain-containing protein [Alphaproteobacteria bacterium]|nr:DUF2141 domain-containing protein [Alphaproteobacteria bacterium]
MNPGAVLRLAVAAVSLIAGHRAVAAELRVIVNGVRSGEGRIMVDVYASEAKYKANAGKGGGDFRIDVPARPGSITAVIANVATGRFGATVIHDENANGALDTNFLGIPREGVGASNNAKGSLGPPGYSDMQFSVADGGTTITIDLDY